MIGLLNASLFIILEASVSLNLIFLLFFTVAKFIIGGNYETSTLAVPHLLFMI
jgi:hypothetical protein